MVDFIISLGKINILSGPSGVVVICLIILASFFLRWIKNVSIKNPEKKQYEGGCNEGIKIGNIYLPLLRTWLRYVDISFLEGKITFDCGYWNKRTKIKSFKDIELIDTYGISKIMAIKFYGEKFYLLIGMRDISAIKEQLKLFKERDIKFSERAELFLNEDIPNGWNKFLQEQKKD